MHRTDIFVCVHVYTFINILIQLVNYVINHTSSLSNGKVVFVRLGVPVRLGVSFL